MTLTNKQTLLLASLLLALAVAIGAFGAHGLQSHLSAKALNTFEVGVRYHFYHAFALMLVGILGTITPGTYKMTSLMYLLGIFLFSFNCYLYAVTGIKTFAMIVPAGGISFMVGHLLLAWEIKKL